MLNTKWLLCCAFVLGCGGASKQAPAASTALAATPASPSGAEGSDPLVRAIDNPARTPESRARDGARHPLETLRFFGVQPNQTVLELWPGRGWYTEILAPYLHDEGQLRAVVATGNYLKPYKDFLAAHPEQYDRVQVVEVAPPASLSLGPDGSADVVLTFRNLHGWVTGGYAQQLHEAIFKVLKPGGVYGVVEHRAPAGTSLEQSAKSGYVAEEAAIAMATAAGFVLEERSGINDNPKDTKDHPNGVWSLPPTLRGGDTDREKFTAIGESDRMTLRFRKPAK